MNRCKNEKKNSRCKSAQRVSKIFATLQSGGYSRYELFPDTLAIVGHYFAPGRNVSFLKKKNTMTRNRETLFWIEKKRLLFDTRDRFFCIERNRLFCIRKKRLFLDSRDRGALFCIGKKRLLLVRKKYYDSSLVIVGNSFVSRRIVRFLILAIVGHYFTLKRIVSFLIFLILGHYFASRRIVEESSLS